MVVRSIGRVSGKSGVDEADRRAVHGRAELRSQTDGSTSEAEGILGKPEAGKEVDDKHGPYGKEGHFPSLA